MLLNIKPLDELEKEAQYIDDFLNLTCSEEIEELSGRIIEISVYMARTGKMLADAKHHQDKAIKESILGRLNQDLSPSIMKELIKSDCENENYLVNWIDRLNRTCTHQLEALRSLLAKAREEMKYEFFNSRNT